MWNNLPTLIVDSPSLGILNKDWMVFAKRAAVVQTGFNSEKSYGMFYKGGQTRLSQWFTGAHSFIIYE